jgi:serine/threonine protein kinase
MALRQLDHPALPSVHEYYTSDNQFYLTLDYHQGATLREIIAPQPAKRPGQKTTKQALPGADQVTYWASQLAEVLLVLHSQ